MEKIQNLYDVTKKLCGSIQPAGDSSIDDVRLSNLEDTINLIKQLTRDVVFASRNKHSYESSVKAIGERADGFITEMREELETQRTFTENEIQQLQNKIHKITGDGEVMGLFNELLGVCSSQ